MLTTTDVTDHYGKPIMDGNTLSDHFAIGSGHSNLLKRLYLD
ncbi:hypothetical protein SOVF_019940 [Spinacia oleracea]|nr:hypothetical protein SOVF_019940 [Spinacia oleracea]